MADSENPGTEAPSDTQEPVVVESSPNDDVPQTQDNVAEAAVEENGGAGQAATADGSGADDAAAAAVPEAGSGDGDQQNENEATPAENGEKTSPVPEPSEQEEKQETDKQEPETQPQEPETQQPEPEPEQTPTEPEPEPEPEPESAKEPEETQSCLSEEEKKRLKHYFDRKATDGKLDLKGFKVMCRLMGEVLSAADASAMFEDGDRNENGTIDFDEFCNLYAKHREEENSRKAVMMASIERLFPGTDGQPVELKKVRGLLLKMQQPDLDLRIVREKSDLNPADINFLVNSMDRDGNGFISKQEFVDTLCRHLDQAV